MVRCPKCGVSVATPSKIWFVPPREPMKKGEHPKTIGIFTCHGCEARFRATVETGIPTNGTISIKNAVERIKGIKGELVQTLKNLHDKITALETERASLMTEIDRLRKIAESRANVLENEVSMLREEVQSLRELLGYNKGIDQ